MKMAATARAFHRGKCLDDLVSFDDTLNIDATALVWDSGAGVPVYWTYGEVQNYASRIARQLSQLCAGRDEEGSSDGNTPPRTGMAHPLPYVGVYATSFPELPAVVLGILQSQCVLVPVAPHNASAKHSCLDPVVKLGVVYVLVHLDEVASFLSLPEVWQVWSEEEGCALDLKWADYGFGLVLLPHVREKKLSVLSEKESLSEESSCVKEGDSSTTKRCNSVPHCEDMEDVPKIRPVIYSRSHPLRSASIAYVMHTSGTTGPCTPVHVPHCCITPNILDLQVRFGIQRGDVVFNAAPLTFDPAVVEIFLALSCGATLLMVPEHVKRSPKLLSKVLFKRNTTTVLQITPSLSTLLGERVLSDDVLGGTSRVKVLAFGGEKCPGRGRIAKWKHPQNSTRVFNLYGITEVSSWGTCGEIKEEELTKWRSNPSSLGQQTLTGALYDAVCIGQPLLNTKVEVIAADGRRLSAEEPGEGDIWLGGSGRVCLVGEEVEADLNLMRPTGDVGVVDEKGSVYCLGRRDFQIKRFGHRMSLEVTEQLIFSVLTPTVAACVLAEVAMAAVHSGPIRETPGGSPEHPSSLVLFVEPDPLCRIENGADWILRLHQQLHSALASHTLPDYVVIMREVPMTSHGKVDRGGLVQSWLRDRVASQQEATALSSREQIVLALQQLAETHFQVKWDLDLNLTSDCGLDSFGVLRFSNMVQDWLPALDRLQEGRSLLDELLSGDLQSVSRYLLPLVGQAGATTDATAPKEGGTTTPTTPLKEGEEMTCTSPFKTLGEISDSKVDEVTPFKESSQVFQLSEGGETLHPPLGNWSDGGRAETHGSPPAKRCKHAGVCEMVDGSPSEMCLDVFHCWRRGQYFCGNRLQVPLFHEPFPQQSEGTPLHLQVRWSVDTGKCVDASPLLVHFPASAYTHTLHSVVYIGSHSGKFLAIDWELGLVLWRAQLGDRIESSATMSSCGRYVAVGCYDGSLYVLDAHSGSLYWKCQLSQQQPIKSSPCVDMTTGLIWCGSHDQHLYALNVEEKVVVHRVHLGGGSCFSSACLDHLQRTLYIATLSGSVVAVDADTGSVRWKWSCPKPVFASPSLLASHSIAIGSVDGECYVLSPQGELVGSVETDKPIFSSVCAVSFKCNPPGHHSLPLILFGSHDCKLYCCSPTPQPSSHPKGLHTLWTFHTESPVYSTPFVSLVGGTVCVSCVCSSGLLHLLELGSGAVLGSVRLPGEVFSSPVVREGRVVVGCRDDKVYAVDIVSGLP